MFVPFPGLLKKILFKEIQYSNLLRERNFLSISVILSVLD